MKRVITLLLACACGGSLNGIDGGADASTSDAPTTSDVITMSDGNTGSDAITMKQYDGTTGKTCTTDADCQVQGGPNLAKCSNTVFAPEDYFPTAVCILPTCTPVTDDNGLHYCDGPDDPSSPGVCMPYGTNNGGVCLPKCTYDKSGGAAAGCQGHDACWAYTGTMQSGIGYCFGGCTKDADCQDGQKCQVDQGYCVEGVVPPTKNIGDACTKADLNSDVCDCLYGNANTGYCSSFCVTGVSTCPGGYTCDSLEYRTYGYTTPNTGMAGYCTAPCTVDAGTCPASSTCTNFFASGPDCIPP